MLKRLSLLLTFVTSLAASMAVAATDIALANPSFEEPLQGRRLAGWSMQQHAGQRAYEFAVDTETAKDGKQSYRIKRTASQVYGLIQQTLNVTAFAGKKLELSADMKGQGLGPAGWVMSVNIVTPSGILEQVRAPAVTGDADWKRYTTVINLPKAEAVRVDIAFMLLDDGTGWVDNVKLKALE